MTKLLVTVTALLLASCAHETTTMDRELALKLADRPQVILAPSSAPTINVNVGSNGAVTSAPPANAPLVDNRLCSTYPTYDITTGLVNGSKRTCFGGGE